MTGQDATCHCWEHTGEAQYRARQASHNTDEWVDALQRDIEEKAIVTIARWQPMAVQLREIVGALHISNDLDRIDDLAENVAKRVARSRAPASLSLRRRAAKGRPRQRVSTAAARLRFKYTETGCPEGRSAWTDRKNGRLHTASGTGLQHGERCDA
jgi:hypothetical protein